MADHNIVVNTDLREYLHPEDFDMNPVRMYMLDVDEYGANPLVYAIAYLSTGGPPPPGDRFLRGRWHGGNVQYLSSDSTPGPVEHGVTLGKHANLYDLAIDNWRNISRDVLREFVDVDPFILVTMFRSAVRESCRSQAGDTIIELHDEQSVAGEDFRERVSLAAQQRLDWTESQWEELVAQLRENRATLAERWARHYEEHERKRAERSATPRPLPPT